MSAANAAATTAGDTAPAAAPKKNRKKLIVFAAAGLLVLGLAGGGAVVYLKKKAAAAAAAELDVGTGETADKVDRTHPPTFVPLDPFVVNLADKDADRFAQIGITLEIDDAKFADQIKTYMPAIRNGVLMVLAHKTSRELLERSGKEILAAEILAAAVKPLGLEVPERAAPAASAARSSSPAPDEKADAEPAAETAADADAGPANPAARAPSKAPAERNPVRRVHFSNFIIQ